MIEINGLQKVYENNTVLDITNIQVKSGEIAAVVGPVGSGKKHLLDILIGKSRPTVGTVYIADTSSLEHDLISRLIGVLFLDDGLYTRQTTRQNLVFHARLHNIKKTRVLEVLTQVGLGDHADIRVDKISSGLRRRLAFGRAILHKPKALVLVEPFERCDGSSIELLSRVIRELAEDGMAVLILADDITNLNLICDTVYLLTQGKITEAYNPSEEQQASLPFKIPVRLEGRVVLVNPVDILFADAEPGLPGLMTTCKPPPTSL
jgi:ABC-2 type transport system ATP-binding protein